MAARKKKPAAKKRGRGQPTKYRPEFCERVVELAKGGLGVAELGAALNVSERVLYDWKEAHPDFLQAMTHARSFSKAWWETKAREGIVTEGGKAINAALWGKIMSCRFPDDYREKHHLEHTGAGGGPIVIEADWSPLTGGSDDEIEDDETD